MKIVVRIPVTEGREGNIPPNMPRRIKAILENAFLEWVDDGDIDIRVSVTGVLKSKGNPNKPGVGAKTRRKL